MRITRPRIELASPSPLWRGVLPAVILILLVLAMAPAGAGAHAYLERSDPEANSVLPEVPESARLWFTEPLEVRYSSAQLFDSSGQRVATETHTIGPDPYLMTLPLPAGLPNGTYSVQWSNVSSADGHPQQGYVPFTIGAQSDVVVPVPPAQIDFGGPHVGIAAIGRWLSLLGVAGVAGTIVGWFWVILPSLGPLDEQHRKRVQERLRMLALASVAIGLFGSVAALAVQVATVGSALSPSDIYGVLSESRYGTLWLARVALLLALGVFVYLPYGWRETEIPARWIGAGLAMAAMLPFSLNSHAAAPGEGRAAAIVVDWVHFAAASVWVGGLFALLVGAIYGARSAQGGARRQFLAEVIPRFSTLAIAGVVILALTGFYSAWLQVGNLTGLQETSYGQTLLIKLLLMAGMIMIGAVNLLWLAPQMRTAARTSVNFSRTVAIEAVLGVLVLLMVGLLTSLPPARTTIASEAGRTAIHIGQGDLHVSLYITPGAVGNNRYTADFTPSNFLSGTQVMLRFTPGNDLQGVREAHLLETEPGRYEASGTEFSVIGNWDLEVILRRPNTVDWRVTTQTTIHAIPPEQRAAGPAPRLPGIDGAVWVLALSGSIVLIVWGFRRPGGRGVGWFGVALLVVSLVGIAFYHERPVPGVDARNPIASSRESIEQGQQLFTRNCATCHGPLGKGDGVRLANVDAWRADLTLPHLFDHTEGELYWWINYGIGGTLMPGFSDVLTDEEVWHLVNYVYYLNESQRAR